MNAHFLNKTRVVKYVFSTPKNKACANRRYGQHEPQSANVNIGQPRRDMTDIKMQGVKCAHQNPVGEAIK
jgi:hypothetical protein